MLQVRREMRGEPTSIDNIAIQNQSNLLAPMRMWQIDHGRLAVQSALSINAQANACAAIDDNNTNTQTMRKQWNIRQESKKTTLNYNVLILFNVTYMHIYFCNLMCNANPRISKSINLHRKIYTIHLCVMLVQALCYCCYFSTFLHSASSLFRQSIARGIYAVGPQFTCLCMQCSILARAIHTRHLFIPPPPPTQLPLLLRLQALCTNTFSQGPWIQ